MPSFHFSSRPIFRISVRPKMHRPRARIERVRNFKYCQKSIYEILTKAKFSKLFQCYSRPNSTILCATSFSHKFRPLSPPRTPHKLPLSTLVQRHVVPDWAKIRPKTLPQRPHHANYGASPIHESPPDQTLS